jgi:hypothetical protein
MSTNAIAHVLQEEQMKFVSFLSRIFDLFKDLRKVRPALLKIFDDKSTPVNDEPDWETGKQEDQQYPA